jgi:transcription initiation factor TFIIIB Brf1 subunit/transcription initiation factor TFIIB
MRQYRLGVLVKYNPCSVYARDGSVCPFFESGSKRCAKPLLSCEMPEYDKWFKDVLKGRIRFYPTRRRRLLLEISGVPLFLYHSHQQKIVGEATVNKVTKENELFHYWFTDFLLYPDFVDLNELETDRGLHQLMSKGRSSGKYLGEKTIKEIRNLSGLPMDIKEKLADQLEIVEKSVIKSPIQYLGARQDELVIARSKLKEIGMELQLDETVINKAQQIFSDAERKGMLRRRQAADIVYASVFAACRVFGIPVTTIEISRICDVDSKKLFRLYRVLQKFLSLTIPRLGPECFVSRYSKNLPVSRETKEMAMSVAQNAKSSLSLQRSPIVVAATAVYIASMKHNEHLSQKQIARIFGITSASIRNCLKDLSTYVNQRAPFGLRER